LIAEKRRAHGLVELLRALEEIEIQPQLGQCQNEML